MIPSARSTLFCFILREFKKLGRTDERRVKTMITTGDDYESAEWIN